jgi:hypothetical protein
MSPTQHSTTTRSEDETETKGHPAAPAPDEIDFPVSNVGGIIEIDAATREKAERVARQVDSELSELALNGFPVISVAFEGSEPTVVPHFGHSITCYDESDVPGEVKGRLSSSQIPVENKCGGKDFHIAKDFSDAVFRYFGCELTVAGEANLRSVRGTYEFSITRGHPEEQQPVTHDCRLDMCHAKTNIDFGTRVAEPISED